MFDYIFKFAIGLGIFIVLINLMLLSSESRQNKKHNAMNHIFYFPKQNDIGNRFLGDYLTEFLSDYNMEHDYFLSKIMVPALLNAIEQYRKEHPVSDEPSP